MAKEIESALERPGKSGDSLDVTQFDQLLMDDSSVQEKSMIYDSDCFYFSNSYLKKTVLRLMGEIMSKY